MNRHNVKKFLINSYL